MKSIKLFIYIAFLMPFCVYSSSESELSEQDRYNLWAQELWSTIEQQTGEIKLPNAVATLQVPSDFYYVSPANAETILVDVWGNPPGQNTLGMLFPANVTAFDQNAWAVTINYEEDGYVSDEDADDIDYSELLLQMQEDTSISSNERVKQGYPPIELVGWASVPYYDNQTNKLYWAKEIKFGDNPTNTLNYNIRMLGRKGVLVLNFIAQIDQKPIIDAKLDSVLALANFDQGSQYSDFDPEIDDIAAYGLGALVAGKVIAKTGLIAAAIIFLKKFGVFILIAIGAFLKRLLSRNKAPKTDGV